MCIYMFSIAASQIPHAVPHHTVEQPIHAFSAAGLAGPSCRGPAEKAQPAQAVSRKRSPRKQYEDSEAQPAQAVSRLGSTVLQNGSVGLRRLADVGIAHCCASVRVKSMREGGLARGRVE